MLGHGSLGIFSAHVILHHFQLKTLFRFRQKTTFHKIVCVYIGGCFAACGFSFVWVPALPQIKKAVERTHVNHNDAMISLLAAGKFE